MKKLIIFMFSIIFLGSCGKKGCTDPYSVDYNPEATKDDGSCSEQRNIKFSITIVDTSFNNFRCMQESCMGSIESNFAFGGDGAIGGAYAFLEHDKQIHPCLDNIQIPYAESDLFSFYKGDNIPVFHFYSWWCVLNANIICKAHINNEEIVLFDKLISNPVQTDYVDGNTGQSVFSGVLNPSEADEMNWIVP